MPDNPLSRRDGCRTFVRHIFIQLPQRIHRCTNSFSGSEPGGLITGLSAVCFPAELFVARGKASANRIFWGQTASPLSKLKCALPLQQRRMRIVKRAVNRVGRQVAEVLLRQLAESADE